MLTSMDELLHWIDCSTLDDEQKTLLKRLARRMSGDEQEALVAMIDELLEAADEPLTKQGE